MDRLAAVFREALDKFESGEQKYGPYKPESDTRDLLVEAEQEILDSINYLAMQLVRIRTRRDRVNGAS